MLAPQRQNSTMHSTVLAYLRLLVTATINAHKSVWCLSLKRLSDDSGAIRSLVSVANNLITAVIEVVQLKST